MIQNSKVEIQIKNEFARPKYELLIDGDILDGVTVGGYYKGASGLPKYFVIVKGINALSQIAALKLRDFGVARVESIKLMNWVRWEGFEISVGFNQNNASRKETSFEVDFEPDLGNWKFHYSFNDYYEKFNQLWISNVKSKNYKKLTVGGMRDKFMPTTKARLNGLPISEETENNLKPFFEIHRKALLLLETEQLENSILTFFSFPEEIKVSCQQYLLYFAQFLRNLGINASSNLKEEAGKVLFSVTPIDDIEALEKIREALSVYLNLPSSPVLYNDSFQSMQLKQQVENLQHSQRMKEMEIRSAQYAIRLAQQNIENQDKIITQQNSFIDNQNKIIEKITSKSVIIDSLENKEELEKFCEGFEVGKSEFLIKHFGLHLNPATILKSAGRKILGKEEIKSIIGSDEETNQENN